MTKKLEKKIANIPSGPGVYLFKDKRGRVIYVGKSANLRARVRSYFQSRIISYHATRMRLLDEIADIEVRETNSEIEALIDEAQLIKKLKPKFNVFMRDSKNYAYVAITKEEWPRLYVTHQPTADRAIEFIGPFTEGRALKRTLRRFRRIFPYFHARRTRALDVQMGLAPNKKETTSREYGKNVRALRRILSGRSQEVIARLGREVAAAARGGNYEHARTLKRQYEDLMSVMEHAHVLDRDKVFSPAIFRDDLPNFKALGLSADPKRIEAYDISNIHGHEAVGSMIVFRKDEYGAYKPDTNEYRKFRIRTVAGANDVAMMREVLSRRFGNKWPLPQLIVIDGGRAQLNAALSARDEARLAIPTIALAKRREEVYLPEREAPIPAQNFGKEMLHLLQAMRDETHRFAVTYHRTLHRKKVVEE